MIKKFIAKLLGKPGSGIAIPAGKRVEVPKSEHGIDPTLVDERARKVVSTLADAGFEAYIVGGAVRDLLLGLRPKDFDVATNATPEQIKAQFRRAFIIGRRFRIVHVVFGRGRQDRGLSEVIEVSTFRALMDAAVADQVSGNERTSKGEMAGKSRVVDAEGRVLRDNVWGPQVEDAARRDFTINAMYYDPISRIVVDYHGGFADVRARLLRMIGDPETRYREDPVRIVRVVRFAAKLGFGLEPATEAPISKTAALLANVPPSRLFDEMIKLLQTGHALKSVEQLKKMGLDRGVFPLLDAVLAPAKTSPARETFVRLAFENTDQRVAEGRSVVPSFMLSCLLWHDVQERWTALRAQGEHAVPALQQAIDAVFDARIGDISGRGKLAADMREIWLMQPRFERRTPQGATGLVAQPRFRAGYDFLRLRADAGEIAVELADWWEDFHLGNDDEREAMLQDLRQQSTHTRRRVPAPARAEAVQAEPPAADAEVAATAPRKRRRRRRKPAAAAPAAPE